MAMQDPRYQDFIFQVAAVGTKRDVSPGFMVGSMRIQNPSAMWLYIPQVQQYIPPNVLGAVISVKPTARAVTVIYVDAPIGGVASAATGGPIVVTAFPGDLSDYQGLDYGLNQAIIDLSADIAALQASIDALAGGYGQGINLQGTYLQLLTDTNLDLVAAGSPGQTINIVKVVASYSGLYNPLMLPGVVSFSDAVSAQIFLTLTLTPENPAKEISFPKKPNSSWPAAGNGVNVGWHWQDNTGLDWPEIDLIDLTVFYYYA